MVEISSLHSCLLQLNHIMYRLSWTNIFQEKLNLELANVYNTSNPEEQSRLIQAKTIMHLDYILLNLDQLIEVHDSQLGKVLHEINYTDLLTCIKDLWNPIKEMRSKIELWRNEYVAHGKNQSAKFRTLKEIDPEYDQTIKQTYFASTLAMIYIATVFANLHSDYKFAISLQKLQIVSQGGEWTWKDYDEYWEEMKQKVLKLTKKTDELLKKNGYELTTYPDFVGQYTD